MAVTGLRIMPDARDADATGKVRAWLYGLALLLVLMVAIGGATRLTGSGLSITEWRPVTGALPPLTEAGWQDEFAKYRASPQYETLNRGMGLPEFKAIYAWEWGHRQLGRLIAVGFFVPLAAFWWSGALRGRLALALLGIGALGGLQGAIGWLMVASGLEPGMIAVAPIRLMLHLVVASVILALVMWIAAGLSPPAADGRDGVGPGMALTLVGLILVQIALGGLVAGSKAGLAYNTWPLMDGRLVPPADALFVVRPWLENLVDNPVLVQFDHRLAGYLVVTLAVWMALVARRARPGSAAARRASAVALIAGAQAGLGITTLLLAVPLWAGLAHQLLAMSLLAAATVHARLSVDGRECARL